MPARSASSPRFALLWGGLRRGFFSPPCRGGKKGCTVGRSTDLPWVVSTTYRRFFRRPTVGRFWGAPETPRKSSVYQGSWTRGRPSVDAPKSTLQVEGKIGLPIPGSYFLPLRRLQSLQSIWRFWASVLPPRRQGVMWSPSISL